MPWSYSHITYRNPMLWHMYPSYS
ncbi:hypothetical protein F383_26861 [Gossypium arboreum]|uniref:Uncharacterized protein n=1 Tax=Gossypium arboreum TaxID=29729 RepID=A0A0B0P7Q8_GOSAR|nr:hypothetical protein F383_26861 [Gossypium arboreum]